MKDAAGKVPKVSDNDSEGPVGPGGGHAEQVEGKREWFAEGFLLGGNLWSRWMKVVGGEVAQDEANQDITKGFLETEIFHGPPDDAFKRGFAN